VPHTTLARFDTGAGSPALRAFAFERIFNQGVRQERVVRILQRRVHLLRWEAFFRTTPPSLWEGLAEDLNKGAARWI
jgi:hypothetical protein